MACNCANVPCVTEYDANLVARRLTREQGQKVMVKAMEWLLAGNTSLHMYQGIQGRPYTKEEKTAISREQDAVASLKCPFVGEDGSCLVGGVPDSTALADKRFRPKYGWLPTLIARTIDIEIVRAMGRCRAVADAKLALLERPVTKKPVLT